MQCFNRYRLILASALLCVLTGFLHASDVRAGLIETPYDSLNWQTSQWGPERHGVQIRVSLPREIEVGELLPVEAQIRVSPDHVIPSAWAEGELACTEVSLRPSRMDGSVRGRCDTVYQITPPNPFTLSLSKEAGTPTVPVSLGDLLCNLYRIEIGRPFVVYPGGAEPFRYVTTQIHGPEAGTYLCHLSMRLTFQNSALDEWSLYAPPLEVRISPRTWVTYPVRVICPSEFESAGDHVLAAKYGRFDTTIVRITEGMFWGTQIFGGTGTQESGFFEPPLGSQILLDQQRFFLPREDRATGGLYGYFVFETSCPPEHLWVPTECEGYRVLFHRDPRTWKGVEIK